MKINENVIMILLSTIYWVISMVLGDAMDINPYKLMTRNEQTACDEKELKREVDTIRKNENLKTPEEEGHRVERDFLLSSGEPFYYKELSAINETMQTVPCRSGGFSCTRFSEEMRSHFKSIGQPDINNLGTFSTEPAYDTTLNDYTGSTKHLYTNSSLLSAYVLKFNDPKWSKQWIMHDYRTKNYPVMDHNVVPVHNMNITGFGITVAVVGEGIRKHPDLRYLEHYSYNFCNNRPGPTPDNDLYTTGGNYNTEGTSTAGVIAMKAGNGICGVGIAPDAYIAGYKVRNCRTAYYHDKLSSEDRALTFQLSVTHIYCNIWLNYWTWNVPSTGLIVPSINVIQALKTGVSKGRERNGAIYIFSSGVNSDYNKCSSNGIINNPYVITIAGATQDGRRYKYSEECTAIFATAYTGDSNKEGIATINANGKCSTYFNDVNMDHAGPPIASGIIALVLDARRSLSYRDVMHIITMTAEVAPLADNPNTWYRNGRGFWVSNEFGFGLLNAENMVNLARNWEKVPYKTECYMRQKLTEPLYFDHTKSQDFILNGTECNAGGYPIKYLEHVELEITVEYNVRGAIHVNLTSPSGTTTRILEPRRNDKVKDPYLNWNLMSVHNWGENGSGLWKVTIAALNIYTYMYTMDNNPHGYIHGFVLKLHGTSQLPGIRPRKYADFRLPDGKTSQFV